MLSPNPQVPADMTLPKYYSITLQHLRCLQAAFPDDEKPTTYRDCSQDRGRLSICPAIFSISDGYSEDCDSAPL